MSTTEAGRLTAVPKPDSAPRDGLSMQAVIESPRRLDELSCARVVGNIADAVHAAHKAGQPLGAVTPAAILVHADGSVKLAIAAAAVSYTAPEQLRGGAGDRRTDVFALGVVLWEALAHERLFDGATEEAIRQAVLERAIRPPSELNANVPTELDAICKRALARDPAERYPSTKVMAAEIDAVLGEAGYPESNDQIAKYVARAIAAAPKAAVLPASQPAAPPVIHPAASKVLPPVAPGPGDTLPPTFLTRPPAPTAMLGAPNATPAVPLPQVASSGAAPASLGSQPLAPIHDSLPRLAAHPAPARTETIGPTPPPADRGLAVTAFLGSNASADPAPPSRPARGPAIAQSLAALPNAPAPPPSPSPRDAATSFDPPAMPEPIASPAAIAPPVAPVVSHAAADARHPLPTPFKPAHPLPPSKPPIDPPHDRASPIATAETLPTPQLPAALAMAPGATQLGMPPGITVAPASPPAPIQSADQIYRSSPEAGIERRSEPPGAATATTTTTTEKPGTGAPVARHTSEGRDVLAGWGWSTGSVETVDDDDFHDTARASRKRLILATGSALGVVCAIVIVALAFSGPKKPSEPDRSAATSAASPGLPAAPAPQPTAPPAGEPARTEPAVPATPPAAPPDPPAVPAPPATEAAAAEPPRPPPTSIEPVTPVKPEPPSATPPAAPVAPPQTEPARPAPKAVAVTAPERAVEPTRKLDAKKPPDKPLRQPAPPSRIARGPRTQPVDPYATPKPDPAVAYRTGLQQYARGDTVGALATFRTALATSPGFAPTWRGIGLVYEKLGNKGQARSAFRRYLQLAPSASDADQIRDRLERLGP